VTGRTKTEVREKLKKLQAEDDAGLKTPPRSWLPIPWCARSSWVRA